MVTGGRDDKICKDSRCIIRFAMTKKATLRGGKKAFLERYRTMTICKILGGGLLSRSCLLNNDSVWVMICFRFELN